MSDDLQTIVTEAAGGPRAVDLGTYLGVLAVSSWGGVVSWIQRRRSGHAAPFSFAELIGEMCTAGFCGILAFWLCQAAAMNEWITAAIVGVSGHTGSRGLFLLQRALMHRYLPAELREDLDVPRDTPSERV